MQSCVQDMSVRYGYLNACDDWRDAITPGAMTAFWGYLLEVTVRRLPLALMNIILFITVAACVVGLSLLASGAILGL